MKDLFKYYIYPVSMLSGTIIGAGMFALPYVTLKLGIWIMLAYFLILGTLSILVHSFFAEVSLNTPDLKRFPGFAKLHLGKWGEITALLVSIIGSFGAILAYSVVGGEFLKGLMGSSFGEDVLIYTLFYFLAGSLLIFLGTKAITKIEFWGLILFFVILFSIFFQGRLFINTNNFFNVPDLSYFFLPYGIVLFSLAGANIIPEVEEMLGDQKKLLKKIIIISILLSILVYLFFIYLILGITGQNTTPVALTGLKDVLGNGVVVGTALFLGIITTFTSFITIGLTLKKIFWYDLKINETLSWAITCFFPFILFLMGINQFVYIVSFIGGTMLGVEGILILLMYQKISKKNYVYAFMLLFLIGIIYEIIYFIK